MKQLALLLLYFSTTVLYGQPNVANKDQTDSSTQVIIISPKMAYSNGNIGINSWYFIKGNDSTYAQKEFDVSRWQKLKRSDITSNLYDKNRRLEGWFRTKIKLDTAFKDTPIYLNVNTWGAVDLYLDGKLIKQYGNTGSNGQPFVEYNSIKKIPILTNIQVGQEYVLALHYVDYLSPLPPYKIKYNLWFGIITPENVEQITIKVNKAPIFNTLWIVVVGLITLLLWILAIQNRDEKHLKLIALLVTLLTLTAIGDGITESPIVSYVVNYLNFKMIQIVNGCTAVVLPILIVKIFNRETTKALKALLVLVFLAAIAPVFNFFYEALFYFRGFMPILICLYYIITSRKTLKGAQWAVVVGLLVSMFWFSLMYFTVLFNLKHGHLTFYFYSTGFYFCFPFGLLLYVAMRFKEIINELKQNSEQVMKLSEEKNTILETQNETLEQQVEERTHELKLSLDNLKSTQAQLIQSEKLASLGELTAGIAHEIQNPLNFVNNFSELSVDLVKDLKDELKRPEKDDTYIDELFDDLSQNQEKINHHGKRASSIVKGMLEHSRASTGVRELTDINKLADEYLRLSYHGLRAKDKEFNADFELIADPNLPRIEVIPQDIGRVLLNLINNAFYAVNQRAHVPQPPEGEQDSKLPLWGSGGGTYTPSVFVTTQHVDNQIIIRVKDNGTGMPESVRAKVFQPFFTTKPTGSGTGLGLSLAYDIVTKGHGGALEVESTEGVATEFIIHLPY
jgi:two-component system, NtrC family, sensor kinase